MLRWSGSREEREIVVLREVVEVHIESGAPVGSKALAERFKGIVSSATIRAIMNELGKKGLLEQPHTSSGRVPTDLGYRVYLERGMAHAGPSVPDSQKVASLSWHKGDTVRDLLHQAATLLSEQAGLAGLIAAPRLEQALLRRIEFVWLTERRVLAIVVTRSGIVHERQLKVAAGIERGDLETLSNYLNSFLTGLTLAQVLARLRAEQERDRLELSDLQREALRLGEEALAEAEGSEVVVDGTATVLELDEFAQPGRAAELVRVLEQREAWLRLLTDVETGEDARVYIGSEASAIERVDCSVVTASYHAASGNGLVALLGPKRLDYRRAIPLVGLVAERLTSLLEQPSD